MLTISITLQDISYTNARHVLHPERYNFHKELTNVKKYLRVDSNLIYP